MRVLTLFVGVLLLFCVLSSAQADLPSVPEGAGFEAGLQGSTPQDLPHHIQKRSVFGALARSATFIYRGITYKHVRDNLYFNTKNGCFYRKLGGVPYREHNGYLYTAHADNYLFYKVVRNTEKGDQIRMTQRVADHIIRYGKKYWDNGKKRPVKILKQSGAVVFDKKRNIVVTVLTPQHAASAIASKRFTLKNW